MSLGSAKYPPEKNASAVGTASNRAPADKRRAEAIGRERSESCGSIAAIAYHRAVAISSIQSSFGTRLVLSLAAAAIVAWLLISWNDERLQTQGIVLLESQPPQSAAALERFRSAKLLSASRQPDAFEASALLLSGDRAAAIAQLEELLRSEPENRTGWLLLANWLRSDDQAGSARALAKAAQLDGIKQPQGR